MSSWNATEWIADIKGNVWATREVLNVLIHYDVLFRLIAAVQLLAMGVVRAYFGAPSTKESPETRPAPRAESAWLTTILGLIALLHFGAIFAYLANPTLLRWSAFEVGTSIRWLAIALSCLGVSGEIWAAVSLGASYSPLLRVSNERALVTAGPYRWVRHPLYAFWIPVMTGWGLAARSWFILISGAVLILVLRIVRVPREEAMMVGGFGESYRQYITRTGRFLPRFRSAQKK
jgi:protein-S-isoprenylcysteine O-methyltransferase Ste14